MIDTDDIESQLPGPTPTEPTESRDSELKKQIYDPVFYAIWEVLKEERDLYFNGKTKDSREEWTVDDFHEFNIDDSAGSTAMLVGLITATVLKKAMPLIIADRQAHEAEIRLQAYDEALFDSGYDKRAVGPVTREIVDGKRAKYRAQLTQQSKTVSKEQE